MFTALLSTLRLELRSVAIAAMAVLLVGSYATPAMAQRYLTEIVVSTTDASVAPVIPPQLKLGSTLNAYLLVETAQLDALIAWYGSNGKTPAASLSGLLSTDRSALEAAAAKATKPSKIMVIAVSHEALSTAGVDPKILAAPRSATLVGTVSSQLNVGQGQLRF